MTDEMAQRGHKQQAILEFIRACDDEGEPPKVERP